MVECGDVYLPSEDLTASNTDEISGIDFLAISDGNAHAGLDCFMIYVDTAAVFEHIIVDGVDVVASKGLTGLTINPGTLLPFGKKHATSIELTSGVVIAHIY